MNEEIKFATHVLCFGQDKWIERNIKNAYPHVDKIYLSYSELPWSYNKESKELFRTETNLDFLEPYMDKVELISGEWDTEEEQRNACSSKAKEDGIDFLFIQDADEFYFHDGFEEMKRSIVKNPSYDTYRCPCYTFWKDVNILTSPEGNFVTGYLYACINLKTNSEFVNKRATKIGRVFDIHSTICYHMSNVLSDEEMYRKVKTWAHHHDFDVDRWYENVWMKWTPEMKNLHPVQPHGWREAVPFVEELPEVISDLGVYKK